MDEFEFRNDYHGENGGTGPYHVYNKKLDYWMSDSFVCSELSRLANIDAAQHGERSIRHRFVVDERVGCIAVVKADFAGDCLAADMDGVLAFWSGTKGADGWEVLAWQKEKASQLCNLLNENAAQYAERRTNGGLCTECGGTNGEHYVICSQAFHSQVF